MEEGRQQVRDYRTYLEDAYQEEVYGEALFRTMARLCREPERARKLRALEQLERETKDLLERAEALAPPGKQALARQVTAHERALVEFATRELAGAEAGDPLDPVVALLRGPPAA